MFTGAFQSWMQKQKQTQGRLTNWWQICETGQTGLTKIYGAVRVLSGCLVRRIKPFR
jgi:hypothetical protein